LVSINNLFSPIFPENIYHISFDTFDDSGSSLAPGLRSGLEILHTFTINGARLTNLTMLPVTMSTLFTVKQGGTLILNVNIFGAIELIF